MGKRKRPMPSFYGKNIAQHAQRRFLARWEAEHRKKSDRILMNWIKRRTAHRRPGGRNKQQKRG